MRAPSPLERGLHRAAAPPWGNALYELVERVDQKVDALDVNLDRRFDEISGQLSEVLRQLGGR